MITNAQYGTRVDEIADRIYRICTPLDVIPGGMTFNSYLVVDDEPLLFHTGYRKLLPITMEAINHVLPASDLRWVGGSHFEADEYGALNGLLEVATQATPFGSDVGAVVTLNDFADRAPRGLHDGEEFSIGSRTLTWLYTPHVPHGWDCGILLDKSTGTLLCGDLFTQPGVDLPPITESEVVTASEGMRNMMDYYAHSTGTRKVLERLALLGPTSLASQHGSVYRGDGAAALRGLAAAVEG